MEEVKTIHGFLKRAREMRTVEVQVEGFDVPVIIRELASGQVEAINKKHKGDIEKISEITTVNALVSPDLQNAELQDAYGVSSPYELYGAMFSSSEAIKIAQAINKLLMEDRSKEIFEEAKK